MLFILKSKGIYQKNIRLNIYYLKKFIFSDEVAGDDSVKVLTAKVKVQPDEEMSRMFPDKQSANLTITTSSGVYSECVDFPKGEPENPLTEIEFHQRYQDLMEYGGVSAKVYGQIYASTGIKNYKVASLLAEL